VQADHISKPIKKEISGFCNDLIGIEVVEESDNRILIQDLLDANEFTIGTGLKRMSSLVFLMLDDVINL